MVWSCWGLINGSDFVLLKSVLVFRLFLNVFSLARVRIFSKRCLNRSKIIPNSCLFKQKSCFYWITTVDSSQILVLSFSVRNLSLLNYLFSFFAVVISKLKCRVPVFELIVPGFTGIMPGINSIKLQLMCIKSLFSFRNSAYTKQTFCKHQLKKLAFLTLNVQRGWSSWSSLSISLTAFRGSRCLGWRSFKAFYNKFFF